MLIIVSTHFHYSDDVLFALLLTFGLFIVYHWGLRIGKMHRYGGHVEFSLLAEIILTIDGTDGIIHEDAKHNICEYNNEHNLLSIQKTSRDFCPIEGEIKTHETGSKYVNKHGVNIPV